MKWIAPDCPNCADGTKVDRHVYINVPFGDGILLERLKNRKACPKCKQIWTITKNKKDDEDADSDRDSEP